MSSKEDKINRFLKDTECKADSLYRAGYKDGKNDASKEWYEKGLQDATLSVIEVMSMNVSERYRLFGRYEADTVIGEYTPLDILDILAKRGEELQVGDEVTDENGLKGVVTNTDTHYHILYPNGKTWKAPKSHKFTKTGKVVDEVKIDTERYEL